MSANHHCHFLPYHRTENLRFIFHLLLQYGSKYNNCKYTAIIMPSVFKYEMIIIPVNKLRTGKSTAIFHWYIDILLRNIVNDNPLGGPPVSSLSVSGNILNAAPTLQLNLPDSVLRLPRFICFLGLLNRTDWLLPTSTDEFVVKS